jgi:transcriptional regulator with XRE-family HTH domain
MANRTRPLEQARQAWRRTALDIGADLRMARHVLGVTMRQVGTAIGVSESEVSRRELGKAPMLTGERLAIHAAAVGLRLAVKLWPVGGGIRDEAQARLIARFVSRVGRPWTVVLEAPVPRAGDLRAVDVLLTRPGVRIAVEAITRLADVQAQIRAAQLKARDIGATRLVFVIAGTRANRRALSDASPTLRPAFDLDARRLLADLAAGRDPGRDGILLF